MATPFTRLLVALAGLAAAYSVVAMAANARADAMSAGANIPAELVQWHSGLTAASDSRVDSERNSRLSAIDPEDLTAYLLMHGAAGQRNVAQRGFDYSFDAFDAPASAHKSAHIPNVTEGGSAH